MLLNWEAEPPKNEEIADFRIIFYDPEQHNGKIHNLQYLNLLLC